MPRKSGSKRKSILKKRSQKAERLIALAQRAGLVLGVLTFILWLGSWVVLSGMPQRFGDWAAEQTLALSVKAGFSVQDILVEGRAYTDADTLKAITNIQKGDPLFAFHPAHARVMIERLSWVKEAHVERRLPDTIYISLTERVPMALWQRKKRFSVIDEEGVVLTDNKLGRFEDLIIVVGDQAPQKAPELLTMLEAEEDVEQRVEAATLISDRRWDLKLKSGAIVKLPEDTLGLALRRLAVAQEQEGLLDKDIRSIDLREPDRITVRTRPGGAYEYKAGYKPGGDI